MEDLSINEEVECSDQTMASCFAVVARQQCAFYLAGITQSTWNWSSYVQTILGAQVTVYDVTRADIRVISES